MKKIIFLFVFVAFGFVAKADQLAWITLEQAQTAVKYLKKEKKVVLWCACCDGDKKIALTITKVSFKKVSDDLYQVVLEGTEVNGKKRIEEIDLAYVHVNVSGKAKCLGQVLSLECDPCTKPFTWTY